MNEQTLEGRRDELLEYLAAQLPDWVPAFLVVPEVRPYLDIVHDMTRPQP